MRISLSVTPVVDCAGVGVETVKRQLKSALSPKISFRVFFFISLSDLKHVQRGRSFDSSCLVLRSRDVMRLGGDVLSYLRKLTNGWVWRRSRASKCTSLR